MRSSWDWSLKVPNVLFYDICPNSASFGTKYLSGSQMTSFNLEKDLEVQFRGHHLIGHKKLYNTPKFKLNRLNRLKVMMIDGKSGEERKKEEERKKNVLS